MRPTHCFSIDVEGFCEAMAESFAVPTEMIRNQKEREEISSNVDEVLGFLDAHQVKGTFFILGIIAEEQPHVVRRIADQGHEIASHSYEHFRLYDMNPNAAQEAVSRSKKVLEDVAGQRVIGFRAPDFSINQNTLGLLDTISDAGFEYDCSLVPISGHDVYGVRDVTPTVHKLANGLIEWPATTFRLLSKSIPALGGGYFRLYPLFLSEAILKSYERRRLAAMFYLHPYEIGSRYPVVPGMSRMRRLRHYGNIDTSKDKLEHLFSRFSFGRAVDILSSNGFALQAVDG